MKGRDGPDLENKSRLRYILGVVMGFMAGGVGMYKMYRELQKCSYNNLTNLPSQAMKQSFSRHWNHCELGHCHEIDLAESCDCDLG